MSPPYLLDALGEPYAEFFGICPETGLPRYVDLPEPARPDEVPHECEVYQEDRDWWARQTRADDWAGWLHAEHAIRAAAAGRPMTRRELSRLGGLARARTLSAQRRSEIAAKGFKALAGKKGSRRNAVCMLSNTGRMKAAGRTARPTPPTADEQREVLALCGLAGEDPWDD